MCHVIQADEICKWSYKFVYSALVQLAVFYSTDIMCPLYTDQHSECIYVDAVGHYLLWIQLLALIPETLTLQWKRAKNSNTNNFNETH